MSSLIKRHFGRPLDAVISGLACAAWVAWQLLRWGVLEAVWSSPDGTSQTRRGISGVCWAVIQTRWRLIHFGLFLARSNGGQASPA